MNEPVTNEPEKMNVDEFTDGLDRWGSDLQRWPSSRQAAAENLLATCEPAHRLLAEARQLDRLLAGARAHETTLGLERKILDQIPTQDFLQHVVDWFSAAAWRPALAATCTLLVGFTIGLALSQFDDDVMLADVSTLAFSSTYEELDDAEL